MAMRVAAPVVLIVLATSGALRAAARFVPLGQLAGSSNSQAQDISADGTVVVGTHSGSKAFRWTEAGGMAYLGNGPGGFETEYANAISGDGKVIVGTYGGGNPFKWTQAGGVVPIAPRLTPPGGVSYDGSLIVGGHGAADVSWDGGVVVGSEFSEGYRETNNVRTWLDDLPGFDFSSEANAVSPDGLVVVGASSTTINEGGQSVGTVLPIRWTDADGMEPLAPWHLGNARDINLGKFVIVGEGSVLRGAGYHRKAFRWSPATGMASVEELLLAEGINVAALGWDLSDAVAVSANGRVIAGRGQHLGANESWIAELPVPGDFNGNGLADGGDFLAWQRGFGSTYDADDYADFVANFTLTPRVTALAPVPEPLAGALAVAGVIGLLMVRRGRS